ncbi:hypothetical protein V1264_000068 [Littorina saxatilis]|uniref:Uncharacterized protein n=1 Tax=Littorina saxatilis TaxID=31220 RepID=A0AAN9GN27_9CAEN
MEDYFASETTNAEEEESDWDEDDSEESRSTSQPAEPMSVSDEENEEIDEPVVRIVEDSTPTDGVCNGQLDLAIQEARDWLCNCKMKADGSNGRRHERGGVLRR